jgi:rubrerythrin
LFNELRAADLFGGWLKTTPEFDVKATLAESAHEEMEHAALLSQRIRDLSADPFDYKPLPAQVAMFNAIEGLSDTCERIAGFSLAGETVANYLIEMCLTAAVSQTLRHERRAPRESAPRRRHAHGVVSRVSRQPGSLGDGQRAMVAAEISLSKAKDFFGRP